MRIVTLVTASMRQHVLLASFRRTLRCCSKHARDRREEAQIRILLVEDDDEIAERLIEGLGALGFVLERVKDGADGLLMGSDDSYDAALLDLGLPLLQGLEVLKRWRNRGCSMPVAIITARNSWTEKVTGLNAGADDYITKPFHIPEVAARLHALIRRKGGQASSILRHGGLVLDETAGVATRGDTRVELTALELKMLSYFMHRVGRIIPQSELVEHLYATESMRESNTIEVYVSRLRKKLGRNIIKTIRGLGYKME